MADKNISQLAEASSVSMIDLLVLEQAGVAKKITGQTLIRDLATALQGKGGIRSIELTSSEDFVDTYTIYFTGSTDTATFTVTNADIATTERVTSEADEAARDARDAAEQVTEAIIPDLSDVTTTTLAPGTQAYFEIDTTGTGASLHNPKIRVGIPAGVNGSGAVATVDGNSPDGQGNVILPNFVGADAQNNGTAGKVPAPAVADAGKYLKGDGTWTDLSTDAVTSFNGSKGEATGVSGILLGTSSTEVQTGATPVRITPTNIGARAVGSQLETIYTASVTTSDWTGSTTSGYTKRLTLSGILATDTPTIGFYTTDTTVSAITAQRSAFATIYKAETGAGYINLYALEVPSTAFKIAVKVVR